MRTPDRGHSPVLLAFALFAAALALFPHSGACEVVTFSGTVSQPGSAAGDSLYVAVLDTSGSDDVTLVALRSHAVPAPPFDQAYSLSFDNAGTPPTLLVVALLDVDGDGINSVSGEDLFGWYDGQSAPAAVSTSSSQSGLDFDLPQAAISGTVTMLPGQVQARIHFTPDVACGNEGFRPNLDLFSGGPYTLNGIYPGTYCIRAYGELAGGYSLICYGDVECVSPTFITLGANEMRTGIDFDFNDLVPVDATSWGSLKSRYP